MAKIEERSTFTRAVDLSFSASREYLPIAEHGVIGDLRTVALVGTDGTIDWYCCPRFDSPSVFAAILDTERGGYFRIAPALAIGTVKQLYFPDTNVLITRFLTPMGVGEVEDFMPIGAVDEPQRLVRRVVCVRGELRFRVEVEPRFDYGRAQHETHVVEHGAVFASPELTLSLATSVPLENRGTGVRGDFTLKAGDAATFVLEQTTPGGRPRAYTEDETRRAFEETVGYWRRWLGQSRYSGRWREMVDRSALTLKLLTYRPTGAIVAAPTTSLPEQIGGPRNWDYRYTWIRDAAFSLYALAAARLHRRGRVVHGLAHRALPRVRRPGRRARSRSCTASTGERSCPRRSSPTCAATAARCRCGSATAPPTSCSSTSTAS